jgi:hypothetical protein
MWAGFSNEDGWDEAWQVSRITSEAGYNIQRTPTLEQYVATAEHTKAVHDALNIDADTVDSVHLPATIASVLTDHTKAVHDALAINADLVDSLHAASFLRSDADDQGTGRIILYGASNGQSYSKAPLEIKEDWSSGAGNPPSIAFHYSGAVASQIGFLKGDGSGNISILNNPGTGYETLRVKALRIYEGTTLMGDLDASDTTWTRINTTTGKNIYTPRMFRAEGGLAAGNAAPSTGEIYAQNDVRIGRGLHVGNITTAAYADDIRLDGGLHANVAGDPVAGEIRCASDVRIGGGLYVGSTVVNPDPNDLHILGSINASYAHGARRSRSTNYSAANNVIVYVPLNRTDFDTGDVNYNATYTTRLTAQRAGVYLCMGGVRWATNTSGRRHTSVWLNHTDELTSHEGGIGTGGWCVQACSTVWNMSSGDYIELVVYQSSGAALNVLGASDERRTYLALIRIA